MGKAEKSIAVLTSGGLDSAALLWKFSPSLCPSSLVYPIFIRQGLRWENAELFWLKKFLCYLKTSPLTVLELPVRDLYQKHWAIGGKPVPGRNSQDSAVYLPGRNLLLTLKAAIFCVTHQIPTLAIGSLDHNPFPDATPLFFRQWGKSLSMGLGGSIEIVAPFRQQTKAQVIQANSDAPLHLSFSCINPWGVRHCGACNKCAERQKAFRQAKREDKTIYEKR